MGGRAAHQRNDIGPAGDWLRVCPQAFVEIDAVDQNPATFRDIKPLHRLGERAPATAGRPDNPDDLPRRHLETHIVQHFRPIDPGTGMSPTAVPRMPMIEKETRYYVRWVA